MPGGCCPLPVLAALSRASGSPLQNKRISKGKGGKGGKRKTCVPAHTCSKGRTPRAQACSHRRPALGDKPLLRRR